MSDKPVPGIPGVREMVMRYCERSKTKISAEEWRFYVAFVCFRMAAILQGVYKRALEGQASSAKGQQAGALAEQMAKIGWQQIGGSGSGSGNGSSGGNPRPKGENSHDAYCRILKISKKFTQTSRNF